MCWKNEWAKAINNLTSAIIHIKRAQAKIHQRLLRNERTFQGLSRNDKLNYPKILAPVQARIHENQEAEAQCKLIIADLERNQACLQDLIHNFGIKRVLGSKTTESLLKGRRKVRMISKEV